MFHIIAITSLLILGAQAAPGPISSNANEIIFDTNLNLDTSTASLARHVRNINENTASLGEYPWQVALYSTFTNTKNMLFCSGALISPKWVLTAAQCFIRKTDYNDNDDGFVIVTPITLVTSITAYMGITNLKDISKHEGIKADRALSHKEFVQKTLTNDIGLILLVSSVTYTPNIRPITLTSRSDDGISVTMSGWGYSRNTSNTILHYSNELRTISNNDCRKAFGFIESDGIACAKGASICAGDTGDPLVTAGETETVLVGFLLFNKPDECDKEYPIGYTSIGYYRKWIRMNCEV